MYTNAQARALREYLDYVAGSLGLDSWEMHLTVESGSDTEVSGTCASDGNYRTAHITLWPQIADDEDDLSEIVVHEVCHCHLSVITHAGALVNPLLDKPVRKTLCGVLTEAEERVCTNLSQGLLASGALLSLTEWREIHHPRIRALA